MRVTQPPGARGSLKWIQRAVAERWPALEAPIVEPLGGGASVVWVSPLADDDHAEYRDAAFLARLRLSHLDGALAAFWPTRGPQWDALALVDGRKPILVEAKSHIAEFRTPATGAGATSRAHIARSLAEVAVALGSAHGGRWPDQFYQFANRLAHLFFLRSNGVDAYLLLVGFLNDTEMDGPTSAEAWQAAYRVAGHALGLRHRHSLRPYILHAHPSVTAHG